MNNELIFEFTDFSNASQWVEGTCGDAQFCAKLFDEGSSFGIKNGRVSKLNVYVDGVLVVNYDRGWDVKPSKEVKRVYNTILKNLESSPQRFG